MTMVLAAIGSKALWLLYALLFVRDRIPVAVGRKGYG